LPAIFGWNTGYHGWQNEVKRPWSMVMVQHRRVSWFKYVQITMWISLEATREARQCQGSRGRNLSLLRPRLSSASFIRFIYRKVLPANRRIRPTLCLEGQDGGPCGLVRNEILDDSWTFHHPIDPIVVKTTASTALSTSGLFSFAPGPTRAPDGAGPELVASGCFCPKCWLPRV
jgi:hypothetical protein